MRIVTGWTLDYYPLAKITVPGFIEHAGRFGYELHTETYYNLNGSWWERVAFCRKHIKGSGWLLSIGVDAAMTNPAFDSRTLLTDDCDLVIAADGNGLNAEVFFLRECEAIDWFLEEWAAWEGLASHDQDSCAFILAGIPRPTAPIPVTSGWFPLWNQIDFHRYQKDGFYCNETQRAAAQREFNKSRVRVKIVNQRAMNAYPMEFYGRQREPWSWHPGDWIAHYVARSLEERCRDIPRMLEMKS